jgi:hypothetical protein
MKSEKLEFELILQFDILMIVCMLSQQHFPKLGSVFDGLGSSVVIEVNKNFCSFYMASLIRGTHVSSCFFSWR